MREASIVSHVVTAVLSLPQVQQLCARPRSTPMRRSTGSSMKVMLAASLITLQKATWEGFA